jgi:8-oxo-dGTP diphosphatase
MENMAFDFRYTLCFLTRDDRVLMLHRRNPPNQGLWNGVGGHLEVGETPTASVLREVREETGFILPGVSFRGILTWDGFETPPGGLYLFTAEAPPGEPLDCSEGSLAWQPRGWVFSSPEVVSNIHIFGPRVLGDAPPQRYHFSYNDGNIQHFRVEPLSAPLIVG